MRRDRKLGLVRLEKVGRGRGEGGSWQCVKDLVEENGE